jgi:hypothetical protein
MPVICSRRRAVQLLKLIHGREAVVIKTANFGALCRGPVVGFMTFSNDRSWRTPSVAGPVDVTRSASRRRTSGICALETSEATSRIDVKRSLRIAMWTSQLGRREIRPLPSPSSISPRAAPPTPKSSSRRRSRASLLVELGVIGTLERAVPLGRNDRLAAAFSDLVAQVIGVVALIGDRDIGGEALDQLMREGDVVALARRSDQAHRIAQRIAGGVDFGAQAPAGATKALGIRPPFCRRAPAAC